MEQEIRELRRRRYEKLGAVLEQLNDEELNAQPLENKRSLAELIAHIFMVDSFPFGIAKMVQKTVMAKVVDRVQKRKIDGSDYVWDLDKGKRRKPKYIPREKLLKRYRKIEAGIEEFEYKEKDRKYRFFSEYHANFHLRQLELLIDRCGYDIALP